MLLLNLVNQVVSYKAHLIADAFLRTCVVIALVLFGGTVVGVVAEPAIGAFVGWLHRSSRQEWGRVGEVLFMVALGAAVFWLYYRIDLYGVGSILPPGWRNPRFHH
jgi:hypothetical protein